jgi:hypothetical protein
MTTTTVTIEREAAIAAAVTAARALVRAQYNGEAEHVIERLQAELKVAEDRVGAWTS